MFPPPPILFTIGMPSTLTPFALHLAGVPLPPPSPISLSLPLSATSTSISTTAPSASTDASMLVAPVPKFMKKQRPLLSRRARKAVTKKVPLAGGADPMRDPVTEPTGITYDRESIEAWLDTGRATCPVTHAPLRQEDLVPNLAIRRVIQDWCAANRSRGVERIPTPKIPVTPVQASELLFDLAGAARRRDAALRCAEVVAGRASIEERVMRSDVSMLPRRRLRRAA